MTQMNLSVKQKQTHRENRLLVFKGKESQGGIDSEFEISRCKLLYIVWVNNKALPYSTGNYIQYPLINHNGKESGQVSLYIYIYVCVCEYIYIHQV